MRRHGSGSKRTSVGRDVERKSSKLYGGCRTLKTATKVLRKVGAIAPLATLAVISGAAVVSLGERLDFGLLPLVVAVPAGLYALPAVLLGGLKIRKLFGQLKSWHLLWFMAFLSGLTFRIRGIEDIQENTLDSAVIHRVVLMGIVGLVLLGAFSLRRSPGVGNLFRGLIGWMTTYAIVNVLSTLWSVYPTWTFYKSVEYLTTVALIAAIVDRVQATREFKVLFDWTWLLMGLMLVSVWLGVISNPEEAILRGVGLLDVQIQGIFPRVSANGVGDLGASIGIVSFVRLLYTKLRRVQEVLFLYICYRCGHLGCIAKPVAPHWLFPGYFYNLVFREKEFRIGSWYRNGSADRVVGAFGGFFHQFLSTWPVRRTVPVAFWACLLVGLCASFLKREPFFRLWCLFCWSVLGGKGIWIHFEQSPQHVDGGSHWYRICRNDTITSNGIKGMDDLVETSA